MTHDEIMQELERMLAVQRELQETQSKQQEEIAALLQTTRVHSERFGRFHWRHQEVAGDRLNLEEELIELRARVERLEATQ